MTEPAYNFDPTTIVCTKQRATSGQIDNISVDYSKIAILINTHEETRKMVSSNSFATSEVRCR